MDICSRLTSCALSHLSSHTAFFTHISPSSSVVAALLSSILPLFLVFYSCPLPSLGSCDISLTGIIASSPMQYKCLPLSLFSSLALSLSFSFFSTSFPFAQKKRKKEPDEPPTTSQFPGMTRMFVPHRLPFAFHLRDRLSSWPSPLLLLPFPSSTASLLFLSQKAVDGFYTG